MLYDNDITLYSVINVNDSNNFEVKTLKSSEGYVLGNMFENEYNAYKNYKPFVPKSAEEKTAYLYKIMELEFAINDLNLYLDINPDNKEIFNQMKYYIEQLAKIEKVYVEKYGPIVLNENTSSENKWINNWPWEKEDSIYV